MTTQRKLLSICVPVFNEQDNIVPLYERVCSVMGEIADRYDFELVFTDNHSIDRTFEELAALARKDPRVRVIRFSRNFGFQKSILTNYLNARGDAAIQIDCDLQDPPEMILEFIRLWEQGYKVVYGVRRKRPGDSKVLQQSRKMFYRLIDMLSEEHLPHDAGDFRLIDRVILDYLGTIQDQQPYIRGIIATLGYLRARARRKQVQSLASDQPGHGWYPEPFGSAPADRNIRRSDHVCAGHPGDGLLCVCALDVPRRLAGRSGEHQHPAVVLDRDEQPAAWHHR
jgi:glycosyltransferase involved in cell wall biosynthesis